MFITYCVCMRDMCYQCDLFTQMPASSSQAGLAFMNSEYLRESNIFSLALSLSSVFAQCCLLRNNCSVALSVASLSGM